MSISRSAVCCWSKVKDNTAGTSTSCSAFCGPRTAERCGTRSKEILGTAITCTGSARDAVSIFCSPSTTSGPYGSNSKSGRPPPGSSKRSKSSRSRGGTVVRNAAVQCTSRSSSLALAVLWLPALQYGASLTKPGKGNSLTCGVVVGCWLLVVVVVGCCCCFF